MIVFSHVSSLFGKEFRLMAVRPRYDIRHVLAGIESGVDGISNNRVEISDPMATG
jgi:hypothetical protein